jgi:hypothetical protein
VPPADDPTSHDQPVPADSLTEDERSFLNAYSGTRDRPDLYAKAVAHDAHLRATTTMPDVPHLDEVIAALAAADQNVEPVSVVAFVENGRIEVPGTDEVYTVREWLERGSDPELVLQLADQMKYSQ